jgi:hypothetical protein
MKLKLLFISTIILLFSCPAWAGLNLTDLTSTLSIYDVSTLASSSPVNKKEYDRRQKLLKKIEEIQKQFDDEERRLTMGMTKDEIERMYRHAVDVLAGAMITSSSTIIK